MNSLREIKKEEKSIGKRKNLSYTCYITNDIFNKKEKNNIKVISKKMNLNMNNNLDTPSKCKNLVPFVRRKKQEHIKSCFESQIELK